MTETLKRRLEQAPVADPFADISEERKAELKKQADEEWETYHSGGGDYKKICLSPVQNIALEAHTPVLTRARRWLRGLFRND